MSRLTPKIVNKAIAYYGVSLYRAKEGYYYFVTSENAPIEKWHNYIKSIEAYTLEGYTINEIIEHLEDAKGYIN